MAKMGEDTAAPPGSFSDDRSERLANEIFMSGKTDPTADDGTYRLGVLEGDRVVTATTGAGEICAEFAKPNQDAADARKAGEVTVAVTRGDEPPPGFLLMAGVVERLVKRRDPRLIAIKDWRTAVAKAFSLGKQQTDPKILRWHKLFYDHDSSVLWRSDDRQLQELRANLLAAEEKLWSSLSDGSLPLSILTRDGQIVPVPPHELEVNGFDRVVRTERVTWRDAQGPDGRQSGTPIIAETDLDSWLAAPVGTDTQEGLRQPVGEERQEMITAAPNDAPGPYPAPLQQASEAELKNAINAVRDHKCAVSGKAPNKNELVKPVQEHLAGIGRRASAQEIKSWHSDLPHSGVLKRGQRPSRKITVR